MFSRVVRMSIRSAREGNAEKSLVDGGGSQPRFVRQATVSLKNVPDSEETPIADREIQQSAVVRYNLSAESPLSLGVLR